MDPNKRLAQTLSALDPGDTIGGHRELHERLKVPAKQARNLVPFLELIGVLRRGRYNKLTRTEADFPDLRDFRLAPTHIYRIKWGKVGRRKIRYSKVRAGRLDAKLARLASYEDVVIYDISEAWQTHWEDARREANVRGIPIYQLPS